MSRRIAALLGLLAVVVSAGTSLDEARTRFTEGRLVEALEAAKAVERGDEDFPRARFLAGEIQLALGDAAAAEASLRDALAERPDSAPVLTALGRALLAQDRAEDALEPLGKAVRADPESARALCHLGLAHLRTGDARRGRAELEKARKKAPADPEIARAAVLGWIEAEDTARALQTAKAFAKAAREDPMGPFLVALVLEKSGEDDAAIDQYEKALALDDAFLDAHKNLAILCIAHNPLYTDRERTEKAMRHFERYFALGGRDAEVKNIHETLKQFLASRGG